MVQKLAIITFMLSFDQKNRKNKKTKIFVIKNPDAYQNIWI